MRKACSVKHVTHLGLLKTTGYGIESACFLASRIWHATPSSIKESQTLNNFKRKIQNYDFDCSCRLCRLYTGNLGFYSYIL